MKYHITIIALLLSGCTTTETVVVDGKKVFAIESIITNKALKSFKTDYLKATSHKAFAQSASGAWNWKSNRTSKAHAIKSALISCQRNNIKNEQLHPCKVINIDGDWVNN